MPYQVQVGDNTVEFPDSVSHEEAQAALAKQFPPTGEDIANTLARDPNFKPTVSQFEEFEKYSKTKQVDWLDTVAKAADAAVKTIGNAAVAGAEGGAVNPLNYIEGFAQGTRQLYGLVAQSQDPASPLFRFKDLVAGTGSVQSRYKQFLEAKDFANTSAKLERGEEGVVVPPELTNPEFVQGLSMILDPTLLAPGVGETLGLGKLASKVVGKGASLAGEAISKTAAPLERAAGAAEKFTAEAIGMSPETLRNASSVAGAAGLIGVAPQAVTVAAIPAMIRSAKDLGEVLTKAGENLGIQPSRIGPLESIGNIPVANIRQRMLGVIGQYGGDSALDYALRGAAGGLEGAAIGAGLGYASGGEEGAAAGLGTGAALGAAGAIGARGISKLTGAAAREARAGDLSRFIETQQDPTSKALFERVVKNHGVDAASALMDLEGLVKGKFGDIDVQYKSNKDFSEQFGGSARGVQVEMADRPTIVINADIVGKGSGDSPVYTLGHELFHALEKTKQFGSGATDIKDSLVGRWINEGGVDRKLVDGALSDAEIEAKFNEYRDKLAVSNRAAADQLAKLDTIAKKADYISSEIAAEHFAGLLSGQKPDALLKGFSGLTRQLLDAALTQNASKSIADAAASLDRSLGIKASDSVLFPDLKQASPLVNAMMRDLVRARRKLDERILVESDKGGRVLKPSDAGNPLAAKQLIELGLAERNADGSVRTLTNEEIRAREDRDQTSLRSILENTTGARVVDGEIQGRFSPEQLSAIEASQAVSSRMKDKIRAVSSAMENGNSLFTVYGAATRRVKSKITGKWSSKYDSGIKVTEREVLPYSFYLSKADNPVVKVIDITKMRKSLSDLISKDGTIAGQWANMDGFLSDLAAYFTNLDAGDGARRSVDLFGIDKAKFLGDFVNKEEKGGRKFVRDLRLDRIGSTSPMDFKARISEDAIQKSKLRWMPAEKVGDKSIVNSQEGYRIISGAKHRLYGPDGKLIGIYDKQAQAERKADATQARLQPEINQQQRVTRNEIGKTAEAGGGNRAVGGQEGQGEGGAVRQAGDVKFMPSDADYLSAVQKGDTQAAQRMVDEAAKAAGYTIGPVYHGTPDGRFLKEQPVFKSQKDRFGLGKDVGVHWFATSRSTASTYANPSRAWDYQNAEPMVIPAFIKLTNPLEIDGKGQQWRTAQTKGRTSDAISEAIKNGNDGVVIKNVQDDYNTGVKGKSAPTTTFAVFSSSDIKSAEPITRDDSGNIIPLSQRFKATSKDIRFMPDYSGEHKAPQRDSGAPMDNLKDVYPDDVYGPNAARYYGHSGGDATDKAAVRIIQSTKGKPDAPVKVFRAIPNSIQSNNINPGDWITTIKSYAVQHGEGALGGDYKILEKTVNAGDLYTNGDSIFEFGYDPKFMPNPDSSMPGAYTFTGGSRAIPGKTNGSFRIYGPAGSLLGIASSLEEAQKIIKRKSSN